MIKPLPKWIWRRYAALWQQFKEKPFTYKDAEGVLKFDDKNIISVMFSEMRKAGWLTVELSEEDARMRIYKLHEPDSVVEEMIYDTQKR